MQIITLLEGYLNCYFIRIGFKTASRLPW